MVFTNRDPDARDENPQQVLRFFGDQLLKRIHTAIPGVVVEYDETTCRARVQPAVNLMLRNGQNPERAVILDVPVIWQTNGRLISHMPLEQGDRVLLLFNERDISGFKQNGAVAPLPSDRLLAEQDAVAIAGFTHDPITLPNTSGVLPTQPPTDAAILQTMDGNSFVVLRQDYIRLENPDVHATITDTEIRLENHRDVSVVMTDDTITLTNNEGTSPMSVVITSNPDDTITITNGMGISAIFSDSLITLNGPVQINGTVNTSSTITAASNIHTPADVTAGAISLKTHIHSGVETGPGNTGLPQ